MKHLTVKDIKHKLDAVNDPVDPILQELKKDSRKGVQALLKRKEKEFEKLSHLQEERERMMRFENDVRQQGYRLIAGIDEVGRGPLAGPVIACAVILDSDHNLLGVRDSKRMSKKRRAECCEEIKEQAISMAYGEVSAQDIDRMNIKQAARLAMKKAVDGLYPSADYLLIDAENIDSPLPQRSIIKGDDQSISIAAASILAKEKRDQLMVDYAGDYPNYGFDQHMGYGTQDHLRALEKYGPTPIHRRSFAPVKKYIKEK